MGLKRWIAKNKIEIWFVFAAGFLISLFGGVKAYREAIGAKNWPSVDGIVISSDVRERVMGANDSMYAAVVTYQYSVDSSSYVSNSMAPWSNMYGSFQTAKDKADQYQAGMIVKVYYDPDNPDNNLLAPLEELLGEARFVLYMALCSGIGLAVISIYMLRVPR